MSFLHRAGHCEFCVCRRLCLFNDSGLHGGICTWLAFMDMKVEVLACALLLRDHVQIAWLIFSSIGACEFVSCNGYNCSRLPSEIVTLILHEIAWLNLQKYCR